MNIQFSNITQNTNKKSNKRHFKQRLSLFFVVLLLLFLCLGLAACGGNDTINLESLLFNEQDISLVIGQSHTLFYTATPINHNGIISFYSSNEDVVTVTNTGTVTANKVGVAIVTVAGRANGQTALFSDTVTVTVTSDTVLSASIANTSNKIQYYSAGSMPQEVSATVLVESKNDTPEFAYVFEWYSYEGNDFLDVKAGLKQLPGNGDKLLKAGGATFNLTPENTAGWHKAVYCKVYFNGAPDTAVYSDLFIFGVFSQMNNVTLAPHLSDDSIKTDDILSYADGTDGVIYHGKTATFSLAWGENANADPNIKWYYSYFANETEYLNRGDNYKKTEIADANSHILQFFAEKRGYYILTASADNEAVGENFVLAAVQAKVSDVTISAENATNGESINMNPLVMSKAKLYSVKLTADWNKQQAAENPTASTMKYVEWYLDGTLVLFGDALSNLSYTFTPDAEPNLAYAIDVRVYDDGTDGTYAEARFIVQFIEKFNTLKNASLDASDDALLLQSAANIANAQEITVTLTPAEKNTNPLELVSWYVNGVLVLETLERTFTYKPTSFGEFIIQAELANVTTNTVTAAVFATADYTKLAPYFTNVFWWENGMRNCYVSSQADLNTLVAYLMTFRITSFSAYTETDASGNIFSMSQAVQANNESGVWQTAIERNQGTTGAGEVTYLISSHPEAVPTQTASENYVATHYDAPLKSYTVNAGSETELYIDTAPYYTWSQVNTSTALFSVVSMGFRPIFETVDGTSHSALTATGAHLKAVYDEALSVTRSIITDGMTDYDIVLAIYEWIILNVEYDFELYDKLKAGTLNTAELIAFDGFHLEGVFKSGGRARIAVCDGKSKAVSMMCGMAGIKNVRVTGTGDGDNHAWNKVLIDYDETDTNTIMQWFNIDTTWGDLSFGTRGSGRSEIITYDYFLISDEKIGVTHIEDSAATFPKATTNIGIYYFKSTNVPSSDSATEYTLYVTNIDSLIAVCEYLVNSGGGCVQVYYKHSSVSFLTQLGLTQVRLLKNFEYITDGTILDGTASIMYKP